MARWSGPLLESPMQWREWVTVSMYSQAFGVPVKKSLMTHPLIPIGVVIAGMMSGIAAAGVAPQGVSSEASIFRGRSAAMRGDHRLLSRCRNRLWSAIELPTDDRLSFAIGRRLGCLCWNAFHFESQVPFGPRTSGHSGDLHGKRHSILARELQSSIDAVHWLRVLGMIRDGGGRDG